MVELLSSFTISQIILFSVLLFVAIKEVCSLVEFFYKRAETYFGKEISKESEMEKLLKRIEDTEKKSEERKAEYRTILEMMSDISKRMEQDSKRQDDQIELLMRSNRSSARSFIVKEYHYFVETIGWIDDFSMDSIENCFKAYEDMNGNSYVHSLMEELRKLPKCPPDEV